MLRPLHGSTGLFTGHGSCFRHSPFLGYPHEAVPRRLASPVVLSRVSPSRPQGGPRSLPRTGDCSESSESHLIPSQVVQYLGVVVDSQSFRASPSPERIARLRSTANAFLSCADPPASTWLSLLGILFSLSHLVPGGRLRVRSVQLCLHQAWDRVDQAVRIPWTPVCLRDLQWWLDLPRLSHRVSLAQVSPDLDFWSDASDVGWGAHLGSLAASGLWDAEQAALSINARELLAIREGLLHFRSSLVEKNVAVFCDNSTAVSYLCKEGGTRSPFLNSLARDSPLVGVPLHPTVTPVHSGVPERSGGPQLPHTEWSLHPEVFRSISRMWPVQLDLFATSTNHQCSVFFSPFRDPLAAGTDAFLQRWDGLQAYAFMPGDSQALHESYRIRIHCIFSGFLVAKTILAQGLPLSRAFCLPSNAV